MRHLDTSKSAFSLNFGPLAIHEPFASTSHSQAHNDTSDYGNIPTFIQLNKGLQWPEGETQGKPFYKNSHLPKTLLLSFTLGRSPFKDKRHSLG